MTKASTPHSSLSVELSSRTSGGNAAMDSILRRARSTSSSWDMPGGAVGCRAGTTDEAEASSPSTEMTDSDGP